MQPKPTFKTETKMWRYSNDSSSWYFITINKSLAKEIRALKEPDFGWGQIKIDITVGNTTWQTCLFPTKEKEYCIPIKAAVRKSEKIQEGDKIKATFTFK